MTAVWGVCATRNALELSERAWISPMPMKLAEQPILGQPLRVALVFNNTGKEPAIDVNFNNTYGVVPHPNNGDMTRMTFPENTACKGIEPVLGGGVAAPTIADRNTRLTDTSHSSQPVVVDEAIMNGQAWVYTQGCIVYRTFNKTHFTQYCNVFRFYPGLATQETSSILCISGNTAN